MTPLNPKIFDKDANTAPIGLGESVAFRDSINSEHQ